MFREYGFQGRWPSPDPTGLAAANPANPQSWNRYAYVMNNPLLLVDPFGLSGGVSCFTVEVMPQRSSQQAADGPFDTGYEEPPQQDGCTNRTNPFGVGSDGVSYDWSDATDLFNSAPGMFGSGASIGGISIEGTDSGFQAGAFNDQYICGPDTFGSPTDSSGQITVTGHCGNIITQTAPILAQLQTPTWMLQGEVFVSTLGTNFVNEFKPGGCVNAWAKETGNALNPLSPSAASEVATGVMAMSPTVRLNAAVAYAASRTNVLGGQGLIFQQNSIPYNRLLNGSLVRAAGEGLVSYIDGALSQGFLTEMVAMGTGASH